MMSTLRRASPTALLVALCAGLVIAAAAPARAATAAPIPVNVVNSNATPFAQTMEVIIPAGLGVAATTFTVPAGKHLVIQSLSIYRGSLGPIGSVVRAFVGASTNGVLAFFPTGSAIGDGVAFASGSNSLTFQADPGTTVYIDVYRNSDTEDDSAHVSIAGYLVGP